MRSLTVFLGIGSLVPRFAGDCDGFFAALLVVQRVESRGRALVAGVGDFVTGIGCGTG